MTGLMAWPPRGVESRTKPAARWLLRRGVRSPPDGTKFPIEPHAFDHNLSDQDRGFEPRRLRALCTNALACADGCGHPLEPGAAARYADEHSEARFVG